jgi:hypothetical protein
MNPDAILREQLLALLRGRQAAMSFDDVIENFPVERINDFPPEVPYTPWHILEHMRIAQSDILEFIRNPEYESPEWPAGYWPASDARADAAAWQKTIADFKHDQEAIKAMISDTSIDLTAPLPHALEYTILREILVVADHNAYHIGEFAILRQVMKTWPE